MDSRDKASKAETKRTGSSLTVPAFIKMKQLGRKICVLTAYDYPTAGLLDQAGVDVILVGDSLGMVVQGHSTTLPVTLDQMIYHGEMVSRAAKHAMVVVDLPFPVGHLGIHRTIEAAGRVMKETNCTAVKLEGGRQQQSVIAALVAAGIPVMGHVGLLPQSVHAMGGYKVQRDAENLMADAMAVQQAGAFGVVLECIPADIADSISQRLEIPTIGIGAGGGCDGQVLVAPDMLGINSGYVPSFVKQYASVADSIRNAVQVWCTDVRDGAFPSSKHVFK